MATHEEIYLRRQWIERHIAKRWVKGLMEIEYLRLYPGTSKGTFGKDYNKAMEAIRLRLQPEHDQLMAEALNARQFLIQDEWEQDKPDKKIIMDAEKDLAKLSGLYEKDNAQQSATVVFDLGEPDMAAVEAHEQEIRREMAEEG